MVSGIERGVMDVLVWRDRGETATEGLIGYESCRDTASRPNVLRILGRDSSITASKYASSIASLVL